jgi:hypothetical protein
MKRSLLVFTAVVAVIVYLGCSGDDGAQGPAGPQGTPGNPQPVKVLFAGAENTAALEDMVIKAYSDGLFPTGSEIHYVNVQDSVPPLSVLRDFDAVLVWSQNALNYSDSIGDALADYVDAGGGLVLGHFCYQLGLSTGLTGRVMTDGYSPFKAVAGATNSGQLDVNSLSLPLHPMFNGCDVFNFTYLQQFNFGSPALDTNGGATLLATETGGNNLIAISANERIVGMMIFPGWWFQRWPEAEQFIANALLFVAGEI